MFYLSVFSRLVQPSVQIMGSKNKLLCNIIKGISE